MKIPQSGRRTALVLIDIQRGFVPREDTTAFENIKKLIAGRQYDAYVSCVFHCEKWSLWDKQTDWTFPKDNKDFENMITPYVEGKKPLISIEKTTKSAFKGSPDLHTELQNLGIEEVHLVGYDIYDCVYSTAQEAFDLWYFTYVIEEWSDTRNWKDLREGALAVLRQLEMTNNSVTENIGFTEV